ncbi:hypothetical protein [Yinghuangia sp. YIM S09857]|uniref:hypothetical protein n=1 Tax=Yinghuangia sp. YIM S09857 TaxID=3436929 RepID=UPI003F53699F
MIAHISGTLGRIDIDAPFHTTSRLSTHIHPDVQEFSADGPRETLAGELREVRDLVRQGRTESPVMPLADTLAVLRLLEGARKSLGAVDFA